MLSSTVLLSAMLLCSRTDSMPKRFSLLPLPLVYYTPETRLAYGAAATATFRFRRDLVPNDSVGLRLAQARPSQVTLGMAYTQNRQFLLYLPFQLFYNHDRYYATGEIGYYRYNYYFYGVGQQEVPRELYGVNFPRVRLNVFRRIATPQSRGRLYGGIRYQYEAYRITSVQPNGLLASGTVPGGLGSRLSGVGAGLFFDTRDKLFFPTKGVVVDLTYLNHNRAVGSTVQFDRYAADVSSYHQLGSRAILVLNYVVSVTTGVAPFNALSLLGGTKRMRGYYEGRFRDRNAALLQTELRFDIYRRLGGVVFGSAGVLGNNRPLLRPNEPKAAYGGGLRFSVNRRDHLNLRLDYGLGRQSSGFYLTIGEAF